MDVGKMLTKVSELMDDLALNLFDDIGLKGFDVSKESLERLEKEHGLRLIMGEDDERKSIVAYIKVIETDEIKTAGELKFDFDEKGVRVTGGIFADETVAEINKAYKEEYGNE